MSFYSTFSQVIAGFGIGALVSSLFTMWIQYHLDIRRDKFLEERIRLQKSREACAAVAEILGEWVKPAYMVIDQNDARWQIQTTYWRNILSLDKRLVKLLIPLLAHGPEAVSVNAIIVEARKVVLGLEETDLKPDELNTWLPMAQEKLISDQK